MRSPVNTWVCFKANWDVQTSPTFKMGVEYDQKIPKLTSLHFGERMESQVVVIQGFPLHTQHLLPVAMLIIPPRDWSGNVEKVNR